MNIEMTSLYVVLVEPSRSQSKIVIRQLEGLGISQIKLMDNGHNAIQMINSDVPDLVISALHLPDMSGSELVNHLRSQSATIDTPFMLISTTTSFDELDPIKQAGASAVLAKPFTVVDLKRAILATMDWENPEQLDLDDLDPESLDVLVVDDSPLARKMICRTLSKMGIVKITEAGDGSEAIPLIQSEHFDLIVSDYNMPNVDGHQLLKFIRNESNQSSIPVMMVTTEGDKGKLAAMQQAGVSAIVDKPFEVSLVRQLLRTALAPEQP
ncbi:MAG: two-component system chemotaxis response regulator CheY [Gammaproteobacteria bacterium]|jgi:two-component system chemotaxis response regulator CheY